MLKFGVYKMLLEKKKNSSIISFGKKVIWGKMNIFKKENEKVAENKGCLRFLFLLFCLKISF